MSVLLTCESIAKSFGSRTVFSGISLSLHDGDHLGIIGPNGAGKSTFLQIIAGLMPPDEGTIAVRKGMRLAMVPQDSVFPAGATVRDIVFNAARDPNNGAAEAAYEKDLNVAKVLSRVGFEDHLAAASTLSGGWRKRLSIAAGLAAEPDVLILDEPTNHLDIEGILWLEKLIESSAFASIFVTHDRYFLENCSTRVAEINRIWPQGIFAAPGNYSRFLEKRSEALKAHEREQEALENLVRREIEWLRRGAKARTSKSKARIQDAMDLQQQLAESTARSRTGTATIDFTATGRLSKRLIACEQVSKAIGGRLLFRDVNFALGPGARLGILGANGTGKTTLLRILTDELEPDSGEVRRAEGLRIAYFDQNRDRLDPEQSLRRALAPEGDTVLFRDRPIHVAGWAARFLFPPEHLDLPVHRLSGGERARLHIARLMLQAADILLLDEPTNDLDIPTLEVLENNLTDFPGAIVLITHDRYLLDRISTLLLALNGNGSVGYFADLAQWEQAISTKKATPKPLASAPAARSAAVETKKKLSYNEAREWEQIEARIQAAEVLLEDRKRRLEDPSVVSDPARLTKAASEIDDAQGDVDRLYERWAELDAKRA